MARRALWSVIVVGCGTVIRPPDPSRRLEVHTNGALFESDRGYVLAALPDAHANVVMLDVRYPVGLADDPPGKEGLAHLAEHLLFEIPIDRDGRHTTIGAELGRLALWSNAETHADYTQFEALLSPDALDAVFDLEVDRMARGCTGLRPEIVAREREVVMNEMRERQGASGADVSRAIHEAIFPVGHPYRAAASVDTVAKLDLNDVCQFLLGPYRQGEAFVVASGAVDEAKLRAASAHLQRLNKRLVPTRTPPSPLAPQPGRERLKLDVDEPTVIAMWPLPAMGTRDYRLLKLVWSSIAYRINEFGFTYEWGHSAHANILGGAYAPVLAVSVRLASLDKVDEAISVIGKSVAFGMRALGQQRADRDWIDTWQASASSLLAEWESLPTRNALAIDILHFDPQHTAVPARVAELVHSSPDVSRELGERWLASSRARYLIVEPSDGGTHVARGAVGFRGNAEVHGVAVDPATADRPLPLSSSRLQITVERYRVGNGLEVMLWPDGSTPLVHARIVVRAGSAHDPEGAEGVADLVGADVVHTDSMVFEQRGLAIGVDHLIASLTADYQSTAQVTDKAKDYIKRRLSRSRARERAEYDRDFRAALWGKDHPYAREGVSESSIEKIHLDLVNSWARDHVVAKNSVLILSGNFDAELIKRHIAFHLDGVRSGNESPRTPTSEMPTAPRWVSGIEAKPSPMVEIDVAFRSSATLASYAEALVLEGVLGSKLAHLREAKALTYGFGASFVPRLGGNSWHISGEVDARRAAEGAGLVTKTLAEMRANPESYRLAFVLARRKVLESLLASGTSSGAIADRLAFMARFDLPSEFFDVVAAQIAQLTLDKFQTFVTRELAVEHEVFGAFGNEDAAAAAVSAARL